MVDVIDDLAFVLFCQQQCYVPSDKYAWTHYTQLHDYQRLALRDQCRAVLREAEKHGVAKMR